MESWSGGCSAVAAVGACEGAAPLHHSATPALHRSATPSLQAATALLAGLIDYAGLFPPAGLTMEEAAASYARYLAGEHSWMLGRFVVPAARLEELEAFLPGAGMGDSWRISALVGPEVAEHLCHIREFNRRHVTERVAASGAPDHPTTQPPNHPMAPNHPTTQPPNHPMALNHPTTQPPNHQATQPPSHQVDCAEAKATTPEDVAGLRPLVAAGLQTFVEVPLAEPVAPLLGAVKAIGARAKVRSGGLTADLFPEPAALARFIRSCADLELPFKATAGLHHPVRGVYPFTYEQDSSRGWMHGFLNVFLAAAFAREGEGEDMLISLLEESRPEAFRFDRNGAAWNAERVSSEALAATRLELALSFGSCSFEEPVAELQRLGLIP